VRTPVDKCDGGLSGTNPRRTCRRTCSRPHENAALLGIAPDQGPATTLDRKAVGQDKGIARALCSDRVTAVPAQG
jgi:hypothetical protein